MDKIAIVIEFIRFLKQEKKYWLMPIAIVCILVGLLLAAAEGSIIAPLIYTLF
jgi:uncharacterized membrane protein YjdF